MRYQVVGEDNEIRKSYNTLLMRYQVVGEDNEIRKSYKTLVAAKRSVVVHEAWKNGPFNSDRQVQHIVDSKTGSKYIWSKKNNGISILHCGFNWRKA